MDIKNQVVSHLENRYSLSALFFGVAYLANRKRFVNVFKEQKGFYLSAAASSCGVIYGKHFPPERRWPDDGMRESAPYKAAAVAAAAIAFPVVTQALFKREMIHLRDSMVLGGVQLGLVYIPHAARDYFLGFLYESNEFLEEEAKEGKGMECLPATADEFEGEIDRVERTADWKLSEEVNLFDLDVLLNALGDKDVISNSAYKEIYRMGDKTIISWTEQQTLEGYIRDDNILGGQHAAPIRDYTKKIFCYLVDRHRDWVRTQNQPDSESRARALEGLIRRAVLSFNNAHLNCEDQILSQLLNLAIDVADSCGLKGIQRFFGVQICKYRNALLKEVVSATGERHAADLEIGLGQELYREKGWGMPETFKKGAFYRQYDSVNKARAKEAFNQKYDPVRYLLGEINYYTGRKMYTMMSEWYSNQIFKHEEDGAVSEEQQERISNRLRKDPNEGSVDFLTSGFGNESDGAKLYFLYKNGIIAFPQ
ncbi:MAG: hypothetical protein KDK76_07655 [Chlamydiia bacterium]|nr:hypothetical protein [Chlamydiia bacterium]